MNCKDCKFWFQEDGDYKCKLNGNDKVIHYIGACLRYAPRITLGMVWPYDKLDSEDQEYDAVWPHTREWDWCGEFEPKESNEEGEIIKETSLCENA